MKLESNKESKYSFLFYTLFFIYIFTLLVLRKPECLFDAQLFAEDGIWFRTAYQGKLNIFQTNAGYCHLIPRIVAIIANFFSSYYAPFIYNIFAVFIASICCFWIVLPQNEKIIGRIEIRLFVSILIASMPTAHEVLCNITNLQWYLNIWGALFCVTQLPKRRLLRVAYYVFFIACTLSSPTFVIFVPILVLRAIIFQENRNAIIALITITFLYICSVTFISNVTDMKNNSSQSVLDSIKNFLIYLNARSFAAITLFHNLTANSSVNPNINLISITSNITFFISLIYLIIKHKSDTTSKYLIYFLYTIISSISIYILLRVENSPSDFFKLSYDFSYSSRYSILMCAMIYIIIGIIIEKLISNQLISTTILIMFILIVNCIINFRFTISFKDYDWSYWANILDQNKHTGNIYSDIPINPTGWYIRTKINENSK